MVWKISRSSLERYRKDSSWKKELRHAIPSFLECGVSSEAGPRLRGAPFSARFSCAQGGDILTVSLATDFGCRDWFMDHIHPIYRGKRFEQTADQLKMGVLAWQGSRYTQNKRTESKDWVWRSGKAMSTPKRTG